MAGLFRRNGINIDNLLQYRDRNKTIVWLPLDADAADPRGSFCWPDCEILIPAATEKTSSPSQNAAGIKAKNYLRRRKWSHPRPGPRMKFWPTKKCSSFPGHSCPTRAGVTASYFEWVQDRQGYFLEGIRRQ